jgi:VanZ family protein
VSFQKREVALCRVLLVVLLLIISYFAFTPVHYPVLEAFSDKLKHAASFFALAAASDFSFPERPFDLPKILALLGYGLGIELVQQHLPYRQFDLLDVAADAAGIALYAVTIPVWRRFPVLRNRWVP